MNSIPIIVPLYHSYHLIDKFIQQVELEQQQHFQIYFVDNTENPDTSFSQKYPEHIFSYNYENLFYSKAINNTIGYIKQNHIISSIDYPDKFVICNPDCFPTLKNWLSEMVKLWEEINDNKIVTLGSLQYSDWEFKNVWHFGCFLKPESQRCHPLDWQHNQFYDGQKYIRCDGNTGTGIMIDFKKFIELNGLDYEKYPHYSSDADFCARAVEKGYNHYCSNVPFYHKPGQSTLKGEK